ncbi:MAG: flagellar hook-basal body complex protein [Planctomycetota bacterium]|nr:flagellar hook-basal body complex protein [Planctomycetota bacterium]
MGLTSAFNTSLNALSITETAIDVVGNNISNSSTDGFKSSKVEFTTQLSRTLSAGSAPTATNGGVNPRQSGLGTTTAAISRDFSQGSIAKSANSSHLAIEGSGFFVVSGDDGQVYTRDGKFLLNSENLLVNSQGLRVQGYGTDNFQLDTTAITNLAIPLGTLNAAQQTRNVVIQGQVNSSGDVATNGSLLQSDLLTDAGNGGAAITGTTLLTDVRNPLGNQLFTAAQELNFAPQKGGRSSDPQKLTITATTVVNELLTLMDNTFGIHTGGTVPDDGLAATQPGVTVTAAGRIQVLGNMGTDNRITIDAGDVTLNGLDVPLDFTTVNGANGESSTSTFTVFDSVGQGVDVRITSVLESRTDTTTFRYFFESIKDTDADITLTNGTMTFDNEGSVLTGGTGAFSIDRLNTGAATPLQVDVDFSRVSGIQAGEGGLVMLSQDGSSPGTLVDFVVDQSGVISGIFDNGIIRTMGQVVLAKFANPHGLLENGLGSFIQGVNSGEPSINAPGASGAGKIQPGALELSNADIGRSLVDLISLSTNYRGNARVISSVQELVNELLSLGR